MTVIAFDGKTLAADKCLTEGGGIARTVTKIEQHHGALLAIVGNWDIGAELREWWKRGANPAEFPEKARDDKSTLIVFANGSIKSYSTGPFPMLIEQEKCAFGSGRDYAEATMYLGANAIKAVQVACHFQTDCGNGVDMLMVPGSHPDAMPERST